MTFSPRTRDIWLLGGVCVLCFFWRLGSIGLFDFNEGFYVQVAREMFLRGDYVTPRANGLFFFDKPPLALWLSALSFRVFGVNEFAARFPVALAASALVFLTYAFGARWFGRRAGLLAGLMVALNPLLLGTARQMTMDIHQSLWFGVAMICFFLGCRAETPAGKRWYYGFWAGCGLSFLAKSVPGLFPLAIAFVFLLVETRGQWRSLLRRVWEAKPLPGLLLLAAIIAPWHVLAYRANGRVFYEEYWLLHHVGLLKGTEFNHKQPFWYYVPWLLLGFFPWSVYLPSALRDSLRSFRTEAQETPESDPETALARRYVVVWAVTVFVIFSLMTSKLQSYLLPMYAAAALLVGDWMSRTLDTEAGWAKRPLAFGAAFVAVLSGVLLAGALYFLNFVPRSPHLADDMAREFPPPVAFWVLHILMVGAVGAGVATLLLARNRVRQGVGALLGTMLLFVAVSVEEGLRAMETTKNAPLQSLARTAGEHLAQGDALAVYIGRPRYPSVFFYLPASAFVGKPLPVSEDEGLVLESGEPEPIMRYLAANREAHRAAYVLTDTRRAAELQATTPGLLLAEQNKRWVLLRLTVGTDTHAALPDGIAR